MSHSNIVKDLLHKLSKNEFLAQDGGYQKYYNKAKKYRNQLNGLYGGTKDEDNAKVDNIIKNIDNLIPFSLLSEYASRAELHVKRLLEEKKSLEARIKSLQEDTALGDEEKNKRIAELEGQLASVQADITKLQADLNKKAQELDDTKDQLENLRNKLDLIENKVNDVTSKTSMSDPVKELFERLGRTVVDTASPASPDTPTTPTSP
jgi:chromosome segregation ATPase